MSRMTRPVTLTLCAAACAGALAFVSGAVGGTHSQKPIALWHLSVHVACASPKRCDVLPRWMKTLDNPMDVTQYADGTLYYRATVVAVGRSGPHRCDKTLFDKPFTGRCVVHDFGVGHIAKTSVPGPYKGKDIWVDSETVSIAGRKLVVNEFGPYPEDTANPAWVGRHTIKDFVAKPKRGEVENVDVTRTPVG
jgi:hypothetical protein